MRIVFPLFLFFLASCGGTSNQKVIKVACAANMQFAMDSIAVIFEEEFGIQCDITSGSSGMLTSQIENGAPYDIFISANMSYPETIFDNGNGQEPFIYAKGRLLFVVDKNANYQSLDEALTDQTLERIGIADDRIAPYGMAASQYLRESHKMETLETRLVIGESIGQVNQYITTKAVDAGFTSYSFKVINKEDYMYFEVDQELFNPINQGVMLLNHGFNEKLEESEKLIQFFSSEKCKAVLNHFGYLTD